MQPQNLPWCSPITLANSLNAADLVLLHSSATTSYSGRYSLLAADMTEQVCFDEFTEFAPHLSQKLPVFSQRWFGYLGYELGQKPEQTQSWYGLPTACMMRFAKVFIFDHEQETITLHSEKPFVMPTLIAPAMALPPSVSDLCSNMNKQEYMLKATEIIEDTHAGELYQANLTRKFTGNWSETPDMVALFARMCKKSPAPYSAYIRYDNTHILSSSPELFLRINEAGHMQVRPIKGTAPRHPNAALDAKQRDALANDAKNQAENLMIVDLMRNDLARCSLAGSVTLENLFNVTTHATIHHMASDISAQKSPYNSTLDAISACFPPGSMTGAPKIRAVERCKVLENVPRGVYSGAIGWLDNDGSAELSVVIRTLIAKGNRFEFQVGGGIVADSTPEAEWMETIDKSMGLLKTLGISREQLEAL